MLFQDRRDAGRQLAKHLAQYTRQANTIVLGLPRGGVVVAAEIAKILQLPLDIVVTRKIGAPGNPEFAIGAITQDGEGIFDADTIINNNISQTYIDKTVTTEQKEAQRRLHTYRKNKSALQLHNKTVILVDDGIATGHTMLAAIKYIHAQQPQKLIVAVPVAPPDSINAILKLVDDIVCLQPELPYGAVGASYVKFDQTTDQEVIKLLGRTI